MEWNYPYVFTLHLTDQELTDLEHEHRHASDKRYADRVKTVYLSGKR